MSAITSPSELNKRITLQQPTRAADGMGGFTVSWADAATVWAAIWPVSAAERISASKETGEITHRIRIRYRSGIRSSWRIKYGDRYFNIAGPPIDPNMAHRWLDILCKEAV